MNDTAQFPRQNIPREKKNEEWVLNCVNSILSYQDTGDRYRNEKVKDHENYLIAEGYFDTKQFEYVTDMYGITAPCFRYEINSASIGRTKPRLVTTSACEIADGDKASRI